VDAHDGKVSESLHRRLEREEFADFTEPGPATLLLYARTVSCILLACQGAFMESEAGLMTTEPWVSLDDVVKHLGVARDSVSRWLECKGLSAHKVGRIWKFKLSEVDAWVRAGGADAGDDDGEGTR